VVYAGGSYRAVRAVCAKTGKRLFDLEGHTGTVHAFCVDGGLLHSGADDNTIRTWDLNSRRVRQVFKGHSSAVMSLAVTKQMLFSGAYGGCIRGWKRSSGQKIISFEAHKGSVSCLHCLDGTLYSAGADGCVAAWAATTGIPLYRLQAHSQAVTQFVVDASGDLFTASRDGKVKFWRGAGEHEESSDSDTLTTVGHSGVGRQFALEQKHKEEVDELQQEIRRRDALHAAQLQAMEGEKQRLLHENGQLLQMLRDLTLQNQRLLNAVPRTPVPVVVDEDEESSRGFSPVTSCDSSPVALPTAEPSVEETKVPQLALC